MKASTFVVHVAPRGKDAAGLLRYLYGPGKTNEHTNQHLVAASGDLELAYRGALSNAEASDLGRVVEAVWREQIAEAKAMVGAGRGGVSRADLVSGAGQFTDTEKEHVYHLIAALPPGNAWTDEQWAEVARDLVQGMGFSTGPDDDKGCRWVAVRHGVSARGNDHLHIAVSLVRQDGRRATLPRNDFAKANDVRRQIERQRAYVMPLHDERKTPARSLPAYTAREHEAANRRAARGGSPVPDRVLLQHIVRAAAAAARTEADWLDSVLDTPSVEIEAIRWAPGGRTEVSGYHVRIGEDGLWLTASQLAPDLTLGKLRLAWEPHETDESRAAALAIWRNDVEIPAGEVPLTPSRHLDEAEYHLQEWERELREVDVNDVTRWAIADHEVAAIASAVAVSGGTQTEALAQVGQTLTRQALTHPTAAIPRPVYGPSRVQMAARQIQLAARASSLNSHPGWMAVLQQVAGTMRAIEAAQSARQELVAAQRSAAARRALTGVCGAVLPTFGGDLAGSREGWRARETTARHARVRQPDPASRAPAHINEGAARDHRRGLT